MDEKRTRNLLILWGLGFTMLFVVLYLVWTLTDCLPRLGSTTDLATVYEIKLGDEKLYAYSLRDREGKTICTTEFMANRPYIYEDGDKLVILEYDSKEEPYCYDLHYMAFFPAERKLFLYPFTKTEKLDVETLDTGFEKAESYKVSFLDGDEYYWNVKDNEGETIWSDTSEDTPEFEGNEESITAHYVEENIELSRDFDIDNSYMDDEYAHFEENTVTLRQVTDLFELGDISRLSESGMYNVKEEGFVNTQPSDPKDLNEAYQVARNEVTIPYDQVDVRICVDLDRYEMTAWEVTFSMADAPEGASQIVYMNGDGTTFLVLSK